MLHAISSSEIDEIYVAIAESLSAWQRVEDALYKIFHTALGCPALAPSSAAFLAIENLRSKLAVTDAVVRIRLPRSDLVKVWNRRFHEATNLSKQRNKLAHNHVTSLQIGRSKPRMALIGPTWDYSRLVMKGSNVSMPRIHTPQIKQFQREFLALAKSLSEFEKALRRRLERQKQSVRQKQSS